MALDSVVSLLSKAMNNDWESIDPATLSEEERNNLTAYIVEKEKRPELVEILLSPRITKEYVQLNAQDKCELEKLFHTPQTCLDGFGSWKTLRLLKSRDVRTFALKLGATHVVLHSFEDFKRSRKQSQLFNKSWLKRMAGKDNQQAGTVYMLFYDHGGTDGLDEVFEIAAELNGDIRSYMTFAALFEKQAVSDILELFTQYINSDGSEAFNPSYIERRVESSFGLTGKRICAYARRYYSDGVDHLINIAATTVPEILEHWQIQRRSTEDQDAELLVEIFKDFLIHGGVEFSPKYLKSKHVQSTFGSAGSNIWGRAHRRNGAQGCLELIERASAIRSDISVYWTQRIQDPFSEESAKEELIQIYDFFLQDKGAHKFNIQYIIGSRMGRNLYQRVSKHYKSQGGMRHLIKLVSNTHPDILDHWQFSGALDMKKAVKDILRLYDFYVEHRIHGEGFNVHYLKKNSDVRDNFGALGGTLCHLASIHLPGGIQDVVDLASKTRPEILDHWQYNLRGTNHGT